MGFRLRLHAYCGMHTDVVDDGDEEDCRKLAAMTIRRHRELGGPVSILERGSKWELQTPDDAAMISDDDGILEITGHCDECKKKLHPGYSNYTICDDCLDKMDEDDLYEELDEEDDWDEDEEDDGDRGEHLDCLPGTY